MFVGWSRTLLRDQDSCLDRKKKIFRYDMGTFASVQIRAAAGYFVVDLFIVPRQENRCISLIFEKIADFSASEPVLRDFAKIEI